MGELLDKGGWKQIVFITITEDTHRHFVSAQEDEAGIWEEMRRSKRKRLDRVTLKQLSLFASQKWRMTAALAAEKGLFQPLLRFLQMITKMLASRLLKISL